MHRTVVFLTSTLGALFVLWLGSQLPDTVASHFGLSGAANSHLPRSTFVVFYALICSALPTLVWWLQDRAAARGKANIPNASYWFSPANAAATRQFISKHAAWFSALLGAFLCFIFWLIFQANSPGFGPTLMQMNKFYFGLLVFLLATALWLYTLHSHFSRKDA